MTDLKTTTVRLDISQQLLVDMELSERSGAIDKAISSFLNWDSYTGAPWKNGHVFGDIGDGQIWLDVVEMGVEYRTKSTLLKPLSIRLPVATFDKLDEAEKRVEKYRPKLKGKGIIAGIIRSAVTQAMLSGDLCEKVA